MEHVIAKELIEYFLHRYNIPYRDDKENGLIEVFNSFDFFIQYTTPDDKYQGIRCGFMIWDEADKGDMEDFLGAVRKCNLIKLSLDVEQKPFISAQYDSAFNLPPYQKGDYVEKKMLFDESCNSIRKDLIDALSELKVISKLASRDVSRFRIEKRFDNRTVSADDVLDRLKRKPDDGVIIKDAWRNFVNQTPYFIYNGKLANYIILFSQPEIGIQRTTLKALFIAQTDESDYILLGKHKENGISVDMLKILDDGLLPIPDEIEFKKADDFIREAGLFMQTLNTL